MRINLNDYRLKLVIFTVLVIFLTKIWFNSNLIPIITGTIFEFCVFMILYFLTIGKKGPAKYTFYVIFIILTTTFLIQSIYLDESLIRKESFTDLNSASIKFFFSEIVKIKSFFIIGIALTIFFLKPKFIRMKNKNINIEKWVFILLIFLIVLLANLPYKYFDNIYVNTISQMSEKITSEKILISEKEFLEDEFSRFDNSIDNYSSIELENKKKDIILVFVLESISDEIYREENPNIEENFFRKIKNNSIHYTNYYTLNQDSRTSIQTILSSAFIPFDAYVSYYDWEDYYGEIVSKNNLVDFFNSKGYNTTFVISSVEVPLESQRYNWSQYLHIKEEDYDTENEDFLCLHIFEYQKGCEDMIMVEDVKEKIRNSDKLFLMQEFIFGHGEQYNYKMRMTSFEYYNSYLNEIYSFLENEGYIDEVTIIVTSDHGRREFVPSREPSGYKIPLFVYSKSIKKGYENNAFLNHMYFKDILFDAIIPKYSFRGPSELFIVGPSHKAISGYVSKKGDYYFVKNPYNAPYVIDRSENVTTSFISEKLNLLKKYREIEFDR